MNRKRLPGLDPTLYEHPFDRQALDRLENTRGINLLTRKILDAGLEKYMWIKHTGDNVRITRDTLPEIYDLLAEACDILDMEQHPELYVFLEDKIRSFSSGEKQQLIALSSGALELLEPEELLFLIGRELGHIKSNHVLYRMIADSLQTFTQLASDISLGISNWFSLPLQVALMHWYRLSEFTADRAGLLTIQEPDVAVRAFIKVAGLPKMYHGRVSEADFRKQARQFAGFQMTSFEQLIRFAATYENDQPFLGIRVNQLDEWIESGAMDRILVGPQKVLARRCPGCGRKADPEDKFCAYCGQKLGAGDSAKV
jgi:Zn-dependent protease with chaperone function